MESPEISLPIYGPLIYNKGGKSIQLRKVSSRSEAEKLDNYMLKNEIRTFPHIICKNKFKMD